jgi:hypothetical protein
MSYSSPDSDDFLRKPKPRRKQVTAVTKPKALLHAKKAKPLYNGSSSDSDDILTMMSRKRSVGGKSTFLSLTSKKEVKLKLDIWGDESSDDQYTAGTPMGSGSGTPTGTATFASYSAAGALGPTSTGSTTPRASSPTTTLRAHSPTPEKVSSIPSASAASSSAAPPAAIVTKRPKAIQALPARVVPLESSSYPAVQPSRSAATSGDDDDNETVEYLTPKRSDSPRPEGSASEEELKQDVYKSNPSLPADLQLLIARHQIEYKEPSDKGFKLLGIEYEADILKYVEKHAKELREAGHLDRRGLLIVFSAAPEAQASPFPEGQGTGLFSAIDISSKSTPAAASAAVKPVAAVEPQSDSASSSAPTKAISDSVVDEIYNEVVLHINMAIYPDAKRPILDLKEVRLMPQSIQIENTFRAAFKVDAELHGIDTESVEYSDALIDSMMKVRQEYFEGYEDDYAEAKEDEDDEQRRKGDKEYYTNKASITLESFNGMSTLAIIERNEDMFKSSSINSLSNVITSLQAMQTGLRQEKYALFAGYRALKKSKENRGRQVTVSTNGRFLQDIDAITDKDEENDIDMHRFTILESGRIKPAGRKTTTSTYRTLQGSIKDKIKQLTSLQAQKKGKK